MGSVRDAAGKLIRLTVGVIPFDLGDCLATTLKLLATRAQVKGLELACDIRPSVPTALVGDSSMSFDLQQAAAPETLARDAQMMRLRDMPVLIVDDNAVNRRILEATLTPWLATRLMRPNCSVQLCTVRPARRAYHRV
jgi:hypothetical protein